MLRVIHLRTRKKSRTKAAPNPPPTRAQQQQQQLPPVSHLSPCVDIASCRPHLSKVKHCCAGSVAVRRISQESEVCTHLLPLFFFLNITSLSFLVLIASLRIHYSKDDYRSSCLHFPVLHSSPKQRAFEALGSRNRRFHQEKLARHLVELHLTSELRSLTDRQQTSLT